MVKVIKNKGGKPSRPPQKKKKQQKIKRLPRRQSANKNKNSQPAVLKVAPNRIDNMFHVTRSSKQQRRNRYGFNATTDVTNAKGRLLINQLYLLNVSQRSAFTDVMSIVMNPAAFQNTKLGDMAGFYEKFRFNRFKLEWNTTCASTANGGLVMAYQSDPEMVIAGNQQTISYMNSVLQMPNTSTCQIWQNADLSVNLPFQGDEYFVFPDLQGETRLTNQGLIFAVSSSLLDSGVGLGFWTLSYDVDFWGSVEAAQRFQSAIQVPGQWLGGAHNNATYNMDVIADQIGGHILMVYPANSSTWQEFLGLVNNTVYQVIPSFNLGYMKAFNLYYIKFYANSTASDAVKYVYTTYDDCFGETSENRVEGSWVGVDHPPTESFMFWQAMGVGGVGATRNPSFKHAQNVVTKEKPLKLVAESSPAIKSLLEDLKGEETFEEDLVDSAIEDSVAQQIMLLQMKLNPKRRASLAHMMAEKPDT